MTVDPHWANVVLALPMDGENNSTTFTDFSPTPKTITRVGDTKILTAQSKWGQGSGYFDGNGDYLTIPSDASFNVGTGDFTVEAWIYNTSSASLLKMITTKYNGGTALYLTTTNKLELAQDSVVAKVTSTNAVPINQWAHVAVVRSGVVTKLYINGANDGTNSNDSTNYTSTGLQYVGMGFGNQYYFVGYIQDLRITKSIARYTADFTPPAEPMFINKGAISGTVYEKNQAGVFVPGAYPVRVYNRVDGSLVASTTSASDGSYTLSNLPLLDGNGDPIEYYVVALDTAATWQSPGLAEQVFPT